MDGLAGALRAWAGAGQQQAPQEAHREENAQRGYLVGLRARLMDLREAIIWPYSLEQRRIDIDTFQLIATQLAPLMPWTAPAYIVHEMARGKDLDHHHLFALTAAFGWYFVLKWSVRQFQPPELAAQGTPNARRSPLRREHLADLALKSLAASSLPNSPEAAGRVGAALGELVSPTTQAQIFTELARMRESWPAREHLAFLREFLRACTSPSPSPDDVIRTTAELIVAHGGNPPLRAVALAGFACATLLSAMTVDVIQDTQQDRLQTGLAESDARVAAAAHLGMVAGMRPNSSHLGEETLQMPLPPDFRGAEAGEVGRAIGLLGAHALQQRSPPGETSLLRQLPAWLDQDTRIELMQAAWDLPGYLHRAQVRLELQVLQQLASDATAPSAIDAIVDLGSRLMRSVEPEQRRGVFEALREMLQRRGAHDAPLGVMRRHGAPASLSPWQGAAERITSILQLYDAYLALAPLSPAIAQLRGRDETQRRAELQAYSQFVQDEATRLEALVADQSPESKSGPRGDRRLAEARQIAPMVCERLALFENALELALDDSACATGPTITVHIDPVHDERDDKAAFRPLQDLLRTPPPDTASLRVGVRRVIEDQGGSALDAETLERDLGRIFVQTETYTPLQMEAVGRGLGDALGGPRMDASRWSGLLDAVFSQAWPHGSAQRAGLLRGLLDTSGGPVLKAVRSDILKRLEQSPMGDEDRKALTQALAAD